MLARVALPLHLLQITITTVNMSGEEQKEEVAMEVDADENDAEQAADEPADEAAEADEAEEAPPTKQKAKAKTAATPAKAAEAPVRSKRERKSVDFFQPQTEKKERKVEKPKEVRSAWDTAVCHLRGNCLCCGCSSLHVSGWLAAVPRAHTDFLNAPGISWTAMTGLAGWCVGCRHTCFPARSDCTHPAYCCIERAGCW